MKVSHGLSLTDSNLYINSFIHLFNTKFPPCARRKTVPSLKCSSHVTSQPSPLPVALSTILVRAYAIGQPSHSTIVQKVVANRPREAQKVTWPGVAGWEAAGDHLERKFCPVLDGKDLYWMERTYYTSIQGGRSPNLTTSCNVHII